MSTVFAWGVDRSETGFDGGDHKVIDLKAMAAEFIVMTLFVLIGCGTACECTVEKLVRRISPVASRCNLICVLLSISGLPYV